jgi:hypothetical protein
MTLLTVALGIGFVAAVAMYFDERLTRLSAQENAKFWERMARAYQESADPQPARVPFDHL